MAVLANIQLSHVVDSGVATITIEAFRGVDSTTSIGKAEVTARLTDPKSTRDEISGSISAALSLAGQAIQQELRPIIESALAV